MACLRSSRFGALSAVGQMGQNEVQSVVTSFDDVAEWVVHEEKGTQVDSGVSLKPSLSQKLVVLWCYFTKKAVPRTTV